MTEMMQALSHWDLSKTRRCASSRAAGHTYKKPRQKMKSTSTFWSLGIPRRYTHGSGIPKMRISVTMFSVDEKYHTGIVSRHLPAISGMTAAIGMHETPSSMACTSAQAATKTNSQRHTRSATGLLLPKMRRYCSKNDILTTLLARLYVIMDA